jgi:hypothetical protein
LITAKNSHPVSGGCFTLVSDGFEGDAIDGTEYSNSFLFQPFMPFEVGPKKQAMFTLRPVFPLVTQPEFDGADPRNSYQHATGLGDIQLSVFPHRQHPPPSY